MSRKARNTYISAKRRMSEYYLIVGDVVSVPKWGEGSGVYRIAAFSRDGRKVRLVSIWGGSRQSSRFVATDRVWLCIDTFNQ